MSYQIMMTSLFVVLMSILFIKVTNEMWGDATEHWIKCVGVIPLLSAIPVFFVAAIWHIWA